jgi:hypothetical protein
MPAASKLSLPLRLIVLDLIGTLLVLAGVFDLADAQLPGPLSQLTAGHGWTFVITGGLSIIIAAAALVTRVLTSRRAGTSCPNPQSSIQTVQHRAR